MTFELQDLALGRSAVTRHAHLRSDSAWWADISANSETVVLPTRNSTVPVLNGGLRFINGAQASRLTLAYLGEFEGTHYASVLNDADDYPADWQWQTLRSLGKDLDALQSGIATTAIALWNWHQTHTHCPRCGSETFITNAGWVRQCPEDGSQHFPRMDNAVIVSVVDAEDRLLLARQTIWAANHFSIVAGFVEPGETFEAAVAREVFEETGVDIADIKILGNQPWPFPASMMIGFTARATSTTINVDGDEIAEAHWFSRDELVAACTRGDVQLPTRTSIARRIIEHWFGAELSDEWTRA